MSLCGRKNRRGPSEGASRLFDILVDNQGKVCYSLRRSTERGKEPGKKKKKRIFTRGWENRIVTPKIVELPPCGEFE